MTTRKHETEEAEESQRQEVFVRIIETETGKVETEMGPMSPWRAEKVERGASINMNHDEYHTEIVPA